MSDDPKKRPAVDSVPGYEPEIGRLIWMLEEGRARTKNVLRGLEDDLLDWTPASGMNSLGAVLYHVAAIEADWLYVEVLGQDQFPAEIVALFPEDVRDDRGLLTTAQGARLAEHLRRLDVVRGQLLATFRAMPLSDFSRVRTFPDYTVTPEWVLHHLMQHEAEHRGEIGMLRELARPRQR